MSDATNATRTKVDLPKVEVLEARGLQPPYPRLFCGKRYIAVAASADGDDVREFREIAHRCNVHGDLIKLAAVLLWFRQNGGRSHLLAQDEDTQRAYFEEIEQSVGVVSAEGRAEASEAEAPQLLQNEGPL